MPQKSYEFFVLGCGPAGQALAIAAADHGHSVGITDRREYGGACPLRGCDPKKVLYAAAKALTGVKRLRGKGFTSEPSTSWAELQLWKRTFTEPIPTGTRQKLGGKGVDCLDGEAKFLAPGLIQVGEDTTVRAEQVIIATGSKPAPLDIPGKEHYLDSEGFLDMTDLPERMLIIGSGYIGSSFAQISAAMGCQVTVVASDSNPVDRFDQDLNEMVIEAAEAHGIEFHFNAKATRIEKSDSGELIVHCEKKDGSTFNETVQRVIHCAGRVPNVKGIGLKDVGIEFGKEGIKVNEALETTLPKHYALGDCSDSGLPLTPVASYESSLLIDNLFKGKSRTIDYYPIPTAAFTLPPITAVGMTAEEAQEDERDLKIKFEDTTEWYTNKHINATISGYKVITDPEEDLVLGAHLLGDDADEVINLFAMIIHHKIKISDVKQMVLAYPTAGGDIQKMLG